MKWVIRNKTTGALLGFGVYTLNLASVRLFSSKERAQAAISSRLEEPVKLADFMNGLAGGRR